MHFALTGAARLLHAAYKKRIWKQHYMHLWRSLFHRRSSSEQVHSFRALHEARALSATLASAKARVGFLRRVFFSMDRGSFHGIIGSFTQALLGSPRSSPMWNTFSNLLPETFDSETTWWHQHKLLGPELQEPLRSSQLLPQRRVPFRVCHETLRLRQPT